MYHVRAVLLLTLAYLALTSNLQISNIIVGILISGGIVFILQPQKRQIEVVFAPGSTVALFRYILLLSYELIVSGFQVARIVLDPKLPIKPGIIAIPSYSDNEAAQALSAHAITLTPGELVTEMSDDGIMYTHCLDATETEKYIELAQAQRIAMLKKIFPSIPKGEA